ncbi:glycine cleavage system aminomethyltransferase GcvT [filamentous cyanobacterium LEGE 11480]|uniref:Aminomethyltransferase n=2 Tax=Romeriopsis TaxID=2992131 RepID=A0A928VL52_9CYAN|nr:glycine cleavage system aminomethyltransferase GcvT [Romeriopsis navalis LEGE 11480]
MVQSQARMVGFSGWEMPVQFSGISKEHAAVRQQAGLFDISHMGKFRLQGQDVLALLQGLVPSDLARLQPGQAQYTVLLNPEGGIIDDVIFYYQETEAQTQHWVAIVNAATKDKDKIWIEQHIGSLAVELVDQSADQGLIAIQGPQALQMLQPLSQVDLNNIAAFSHVETEMLGTTAFVARTGYTGEDGFEIMIPAATASTLWQSLTAAGATPCGLGARDTLRLEAAMSLYGQDINDQTSPLEAGLGWLVHWDKTVDFIGKDVLAKQKAAGVERRIVGLQLEGRNIARHDYPIVQADQTIGIVTSGTLSPTLGYPIALAYVPAAMAKVGNTVDVQIRNKAVPATIVKRPFYRSPNK